MKNHLSTSLHMALSMFRSATWPFNQTETPTRTKGPANSRSRVGKFMRRYNRKYSRPHQGAQEIARRKSQIERGILQVSKP